MMKQSMYMTVTIISWTTSDKGYNATIRSHSFESLNSREDSSCKTWTQKQQPGVELGKLWIMTKMVCE